MIGSDGGRDAPIFGAHLDSVVLESIDRDGRSRMNGGLAELDFYANWMRHKPPVIHMLIHWQSAGADAPRQRRRLSDPAHAAQLALTRDGHFIYEDFNILSATSRSSRPRKNAHSGRTWLFRLSRSGGYGGGIFD